MKKTVIVTSIACLVFGAFVLGQNQTKEKRIEPCCCKHTQQIADDLHWIRESMSKPYVPPELPALKIPEPSIKHGELKVTQFDFKLKDPPNFKTPKKPK
jgi:hypothetical protein